MKYLLFILSILVISCSNELEKLPLEAPSSETFPSTEQELNTAIVGCNNPLTFKPNGENPFLVVFDMYSDIATNRDVTPQSFWGDPNGGDVTSTWKTMYTGISRCNFLLDNINRASGNVSNDKILQVQAKARFLRAYYYFILSQLYGGVPLIIHTQSLSEAYVTKNTKDEVVTFILSELEEAATSLSGINQPNTMEITKLAAWGLESRIALFNGQWQRAIDAAQKVMALEGTQCELNPSFGDICLRAGKTSKEILWAIQFNYNDITHITPQTFRSRMASGYCNRIPVQSLVDSYECIDGLPIDKSPLYNPQKPFENRDPRLGLTIVCPGSIFYGYQFETHKDSLYCWNYNVSPAKRVANLDATATYASFSGYAWRKYADPKETDATKSDINAIALRYAEVLLNYAEAKIESNSIDASVYTAINKVRQRAGVPIITSGKTQSELRSVVRKERKVEFACEGLRYFDIIRWKIAENVLNGPCYGRIPKGLLASAPKIDENGTPDYSSVSNISQMRVIQMRLFDKSKNYLWPIPGIEIQTNSKLVQNPNY
jgi:starch-binding outer membrane protein, SusD/RagB family